MRTRQKEQKAAPQQNQAISVTSCPGNLRSGPTVGLEIRLPEVGLLTLDMCRDEAYDLANELLAAVARAQRKHEQQFGPGWSDAV
jgi:hypothetical protein